MTFGSVITAMVTPFHDDGKVNFQKAQELAQYLLENGSDSLVVSGTTGESPTLSFQEKIDLFSAVKESVNGKGYVIAGTGTYSTEESVELSKLLQSRGGWFNVSGTIITNLLKKVFIDILKPLPRALVCPLYFIISLPGPAVIYCRRLYKDSVKLKILSD